MAFHTGEYHVYLFLGDPKVEPLWKWSVWSKFLPALAPVIDRARGKPSYRSYQWLPNRESYARFGRMMWNERGHQSWTHGSPRTRSASKTWNFLNVELWAPSWTICEKDNRAPDVFLEIGSQRFHQGPDDKLKFDQTVVFAIAVGVADRSKADVSNAVSTLARLTKAKWSGYQQRPWGKAFGSIGYTDSIQDLCATGLFKPGPRHKAKVGSQLLREKWKPIT